MPDGGRTLPIDELESIAKSIDYHACAKAFLALKGSVPRRPAHLADHPVMHAWMSVLAKEAKLLHEARRIGLSEDSVRRYFIRSRGRGIPRSPKWQAVLQRMKERGAKL
jgi:hypothetical protein